MTPDEMEVAKEMGRVGHIKVESLTPGAPLLAFEKWPAENRNRACGGSIAGHPSAIAQSRLSQKA